MKATFTVAGTPVAKGRPRLGKFGTYTPEKTVNYENLVKLSYADQCENQKLNGYLIATIIAYMPIPKSTSKKNRQQMIDGTILPDKKPDVDNIAKGILDSLNGIAYDDDSAVVTLHVAKQYSENPRVAVSIEEINRAPARNSKTYSCKDCGYISPPLARHDCVCPICGERMEV